MRPIQTMMSSRNSAVISPESALNSGTQGSSEGNDPLGEGVPEGVPRGSVLFGASALVILGHASLTLGDPHEAIDYFERALTVSRDIPDDRGEGVALDNLGLAYVAIGEYSKAIDFHQRPWIFPMIWTTDSMSV